MVPDAPTDPWSGMSAARLGVCVDFPFCLSKCPYCDFASVAAKQIPEERYAAAVLRELDLRLASSPSLDGSSIHSVFFGGGTPSLWAPEAVGPGPSRIAGRLPPHPP